MFDDVVNLRPASPSDLSALADLRWSWANEHTPPAEGRREFAERFLSWAQGAGVAHSALVAETDGAVIAMAWIVAVSRLPDADRADVVHGDLQSVYVRPDCRNQGVGGQLVDYALTYAASVGISIVTVRAGRRSLALYERAGFRSAGRLLERSAVR